MTTLRKRGGGQIHTEFQLYGNCCKQFLELLLPYFFFPPNLQHRRSACQRCSGPCEQFTASRFELGTLRQAVSADGQSWLAQAGEGLILVGVVTGACLSLGGMGGCCSPDQSRSRDHMSPDSQSYRDALLWSGQSQRIPALSRIALLMTSKSRLASRLQP